MLILLEASSTIVLKFSFLSNFFVFGKLTLRTHYFIITNSTSDLDLLPLIKLSIQFAILSKALIV